MGSWFVTPETDRLSLSDGEWILVRRRLNMGEEEAYETRAFVSDDGTVARHPLRWRRALVAAYVLDWSLTDDTGEKIVIRPSPVEPPDVEALAARLTDLDPDRFTEILRAVQAHIETQRTRREAQKKTPAGRPASDPISASPFAPAGVLTTSAP